MQVLYHLDPWRALRAHFPTEVKVGFVPTMGNLHAGHLSLCKKSMSENDLTIVSLYVNPTQFNHADDFTHYPRTLDADLALLKEKGIHYCLVPTDAELYPDSYRYKIEETQLSSLLEGTQRPGHFAGMLTIVMKLFQLVQPHRAYFGEKDYQQYELVQGMVNAFFMPIAVTVCPTIREPSGLACSSRNTRLNPEEKQLAETFAQIFTSARSLADMRHELASANILVEYLEKIEDRIYIAVKIGLVRLIDNRKDCLPCAH